MKILRHPITTVVEYILAAMFTLLYVSGSTAPKYEEFLGLVFFTVFLSVGALSVSLTAPRPVLNPIVFAALCFLGWAGCCWMLHRQYGYDVTGIPAFWDGVHISAAAYFALLGINVLLAGSLQRVLRGRPIATERMLRKRLRDTYDV